MGPPKKAALRPGHIWEKTKLDPQQGGALRPGQALRPGPILEKTRRINFIVP